MVVKSYRGCGCIGKYSYDFAKYYLYSLMVSIPYCESGDLETILAQEIQQAAYPVVNSSLSSWSVDRHKEKPMKGIL